MLKNLFHNYIKPILPFIAGIGAFAFSKESSLIPSTPLILGALAGIGTSAILKLFPTPEEETTQVNLSAEKQTKTTQPRELISSKDSVVTSHSQSTPNENVENSENEISNPRSHSAPTPLLDHQ